LSERTDPSRAAGDADGDPASLIARLRDTVERQRRVIAEQRATIDTLRRSTGSAPTKESSPGPASRPLASAPPEPPKRETRNVAEPVSGFDYTIVFDGGAIGNPGRGYGSYQIVGRDGLIAQERLEYGDRVTNNQAEYRTLVEALEDLRDRLGREAARASVAVRGDSQLVVQQVTGRWKVKHPELQPLRARVVELLRGFSRSDVAWHRRDASVRVLGH
jgi:ribonuclease HI